jgi:hypothetical protein
MSMRTIEMPLIVVFSPVGGAELALLRAGHCPTDRNLVPVANQVLHRVLEIGKGSTSAADRLPDALNPRWGPRGGLMEDNVGGI